VVLDEFPEWLQRSSIDRIKNTQYQVEQDRQRDFRFFITFLQIKPISTFDMKDAQGSAKHRLVFVLK
jgi:hypothetical protein